MFSLQVLFYDDRIARANWVGTNKRVPDDNIFIWRSLFLQLLAFPEAEAESSIFCLHLLWRQSNWTTRWLSRVERRKQGWRRHPGNNRLVSPLIFSDILINDLIRHQPQSAFSWRCWQPELRRSRHWSKSIRLSKRDTCCQSWWHTVQRKPIAA